MTEKLIGVGAWAIIAILTLDLLITGALGTLFIIGLIGFFFFA